VLLGLQVQNVKPRRRGKDEQIGIASEMPLHAIAIWIKHDKDMPRLPASIYFNMYRLYYFESFQF
jgi:hypothetical protein